MAVLNVTNISAAGAQAVPVAASGGGDTVRCGERTFISVANGAGSGSVTVTVNDTKTRTPVGATAFDPDVEVVVAFGTSKFIGPLLAGRFANSAGFAEITYSGVSDVTVTAANV